MRKLKAQLHVSPRISVDNRLLLIKVGVAVLGTLVVFIAILIVLSGSHNSKAAPPPVITSIGGVINSYAAVTGFSNANKRFTVANISGNLSDFDPGSKILIIQMKGANISTTNDATYGSISGYARAGNYEFATVSSRTNTAPYRIVVDNLVRNYANAGMIQLVSVPQYESVLVNSAVTAIPWDPILGRGGIIVFEAKNEVTLNANIQADGVGFVGGAASGGANGGATDNTTYKTDNTTGYGQKGEGIGNFTTGEEYGRGAIANGGGGGNTHNAGGGGGGNFTAGGEGGTGWGGAGGGSGGQGIGGYALNYNAVNNRIFMGGGGGGGQQNNGIGSAGANGGGIIIIRAATLNSSCSGTFTISANGSSAPDTGGNDGAGGGGGGGTVFLDVLQYISSCSINVMAKGGNGGTVQTADKHGGGGGGGSGATLFNVAPGSNITVDNTRGVAGNDCNAGGCTATALPGYPCTSNCYPSGWTPTGDVMLLPVELLFFKGKATENSNVLEWATASEINNDFFTLEKSIDGKTFTSLAIVDGSGTKITGTSYRYTDYSKNIGGEYYRLLQTDYDGKRTSFPIIYIKSAEKTEEKISISPNPFSTNFTIDFHLEKAEEIELVIYNIEGKIKDRKLVSFTAGNNRFTYSADKLSPGIYFLTINSTQFKSNKLKILKE